MPAFVVTEGAQVEILSKNAFHALPGIVNVTGSSPGIGHVGTPCAGEGPAAHVIYDVLLATVPDGV